MLLPSYLVECLNLFFVGSFCIIKGMTDEQEPPTAAEAASAMRKVLEEFAPDADPQDVEDFVADLEGVDDPEQLEVNLGDGIGALVESGRVNAAFERYAELIEAERVKSNPIPASVPGDADEPQGEAPTHMEDI